MMVLTHVVVGAAIGEEANNPLLAFILGVISHLLIDKIPHFWPKNRKKWDSYFKWIDITLSIIAMIIFWIIGYHSLSFWAGIAGSVSIDVIAKIAPYINYKKFAVWQEKRQPHMWGKPIYLLNDVAIIIISLTTLWSHK
jgi:hypothetical protein